MFRRLFVARADEPDAPSPPPPVPPTQSDEPPVAEPVAEVAEPAAAAVSEEVVVEAVPPPAAPEQPQQEQAPPAPEPEPASPPPPAAPMAPAKLSEADVEAVKEEIVKEVVDKLLSIEGAVVPEITTAPYDPRFPTTNQNRHCFIRYNEFYKCKFERGDGDQRCQFYKRAYESLCPPDWVEEWEELRANGLWFGRF